MLTYTLAVVTWLSLCRAQLTIPSVTSFSPTSAQTSFNLPQLDTSNRRLYVTVSICSALANSLEALQNSPILAIQTATGDSLTTPSLGGLASTHVNIKKTQPTSILVNLPASTGNISSWNVELGLSYQQPLHGISPSPLFQFYDADNSSAFFISPTFAKQGVAPSFTPVLSATDAINSLIPTQLSNSSCFISTLSARLQPASNITATTSDRGVQDLSNTEGGPLYSGGGQRVEYMARNLDASTNYTLVGASKGTDGASTIYASQYFKTMAAASKCRLMSDVSFCPGVTYSVPSAPELSSSQLLDLYNNSMFSSLQDFQTSLSLFPCGDQDQGMYSYTRTCSDCNSAYQSWLCSINMPRCSDTTQPLPSSGLTRPSAQFSRTPFLPESAFPYNEIPPCISLCNIVRASCPPSMGWTCPSHQALSLTIQAEGQTHNQIPLSIGDTVSTGYNPFLELDSDQRQGGALVNASSAGSDRFGQVFCNALGTDIYVNLRSNAGAVSPRLGIWIVVTVVGAALVAL